MHIFSFCIIICTVFKDFVYALDIQFEKLYAITFVEGEGLAVFHESNSPCYNPSNLCRETLLARGVLWLRGQNILPISLFETKRDERLIYSEKSAKILKIRDFENALTLRQIISRVEERPEICSPDARDLYFEVQEIVCFGLGYKQVLLRQRILTHQENNGQLGSMAKSVFSPYISPLIKYLLNHEDVGYQISTNNWGEIEDSFIFYHRGHETTARLMADLKVQDTSIPGQPNQLEKIIYAVLCGRLLGYSEKSVFDYVVEVANAREEDWRKGLERYAQYQKRYSIPSWELGQSKIPALFDFKFWATSEFEFDFETIREITFAGNYLWEIPKQKTLRSIKSEL